MTKKRYRKISYQADILGGNYPMQALHVPAREETTGDQEWRVIAIPGTPSRDYVFYRFLHHAPDNMEVTMVTRAGYLGGHYGTGISDPVLSFDDQVKAIAPLFQKDDGRRALIMGVSYGGALALKSALDYPQYVDGVMTVAMLVHEPRAYVRAGIKLGGVPGINHILPQYLKNARREVIARRAQITPLFDDLKKMHQPVTIIHGNRDSLVPLSSVKDLKSYFTNEQDVEFSLAKNGSHYLECERPRFLYQELEKLKKRA